MQKKSVNIICSIDGHNIARKCIKSFEVERNFADVANKFTMTLIDYPGVNGTDLELYMNAGHRSIKIAYSDATQDYVQFSGQIWDYTNNFTGNMKSLVISGNVSKIASYDKSGKASYNIDWNSYYNIRKDETKNWNIILMQDQADQLYYEWASANMTKKASDRNKLSSFVINDSYRKRYNENSVKIVVQGPGGSIKLPVPDSFYEMQGKRTTTVPLTWVEDTGLSSVLHNDGEKEVTVYNGDESSEGPWGSLYVMYSPKRGIALDKRIQKEMYAGKTTTSNNNRSRTTVQSRANKSTPDDYYNLVIGKGFDVDFEAGVQCVDGFKHFCKTVLGFTPGTLCNPTEYAHSIWDNFYLAKLSNYFDKVTVKEMQDGDWAIWALNSGPHCPKSHVAMFRKKVSSNSGLFLGQNQGAAGGAYSQKEISFSGIRGALRPKYWNKIDASSSGGSSSSSSTTKHTIASEVTEKNGKIIFKGNRKAKIEEAITNYGTDDQKKLGADKLFNVADYHKIWYQNKLGANGKPVIRAFRRAGEKTAYIQANPKWDYFGAGTFLESTEGVDITHIIKQLCDLEGWRYTDTSIVQTELVPCEDAFKMNNIGAMEFIQEVLVPRSVLPCGLYTKKGGGQQEVTTGKGGFVAFFDDSGIFHYEPLAKSFYNMEALNLVMGYNVKNSPVLSFQVDTKGTAFYTTNNQELNSMSIVTGEPYSSATVSSEQALDNYNKVKGHNESLDAFFGLKYSEIAADKTWSEALTKGNYQYYVGFTGSTINDGVVSSSKITDKLVSTISSSGVASGGQTATTLAKAYDKIKTFMLSGTLSMWANTKVTPASIIQITNMVKMFNSNYTEVHPTSGKYLVLKQKDSISGEDFIQQLSLLRYNADYENKIDADNIDYSQKAVEFNITKTQSSNTTTKENKKETYSIPGSGVNKDRHLTYESKGEQWNFMDDMKTYNQKQLEQAQANLNKGLNKK